MTYDTQPFIEQPSFEFVDLDVNDTIQTRVLNWVSDGISVQNPTPYPLYINWRTGAIPSPIAYEERVPPGAERVFPAKGNNFGFFLDVGISTDVIEKCAILIFRASVIPNSSVARFRAVRTKPITQAAGGIDDTIINTSGSEGLLVNFQVLTGTQGVSVEIAVSYNGTTFFPIRVYKVTTVNTLIQSFPASVNFFRIRVTNLDSGGGSTSTLSYSVLSVYSPVPISERSQINSGRFASILTGSTVSAPTIVGRLKISKLYIYFELPLNTSTFQITLQAAIDSIALTTQFLQLSNVGGGLATAFDGRNADVGIHSQKLIHRRLTQWGYEIDVSMQCTSAFALGIINASGITLTNVRIAHDYKVET